MLGVASPPTLRTIHQEVVDLLAAVEAGRRATESRVDVAQEQAQEALGTIRREMVDLQAAAESWADVAQERAQEALGAIRREMVDLLAAAEAGRRAAESRADVAEARVHDMERWMQLAVAYIDRAPRRAPRAPPSQRVARRQPIRRTRRTIGEE